MPKKVLYVLNEMGWFWSHRLPLARGAQDKGWAVYVCATGAATDEKLKQHDMHGLDLPKASGKSLFEIIQAIKTHVKHVQPDLVHAIGLKNVFLTGMALMFQKNVRRLYTLAGLGYLFTKGWKPTLLRWLVAPFLKPILKHKRAAIIFQNPDDMRLMIKHSYVRESQSHLILGSGVDLDVFTPQPEPPGTPHIVMATRLLWDKGVREFFEAAAIIKERGVEVKFTLAGGLDDINPKAITQTEMETLTENSPVEWIGKTSDVAALYASAHVVVLPSYYREGIPKALLEAAASGRAIITTDWPGCREAVIHNETGLTVPIRDVNTLANAIELLIKDDEKRIQMGQRARQLAEQKFDVQLIVKQTLQLYEAGDD